VGSFGQLALARDAALGSQVNPMLPMEAMGAGAGLMGLLTGQAQQTRLFPLQQQLMQQRVQAGQMQLDAAQRQLQDRQRILQSLQNNQGNMAAVLKDPNVYGQIDPDTYVNLQAEHTKMQEVQGEFDDRQLQVNKDRNSRRAAMMFGAAQMGPQNWAQNGPAIIAGYNAIGDDEKLDPNTPFEAVPRIALQHATLTEYHAQEELTRQREQDVETQRHNLATEADKNQPKPGVDVPYSPAVQQQKIDIARQSRPPREPKDQGLTMVVPNQDGSSQVVRVQPGQSLPAGAQTPAGFATMTRPTQQQRNISAQAQVAVDGIPPTLAEIDRLKDKIGPVAGRWDKFMQGSVGLNDPDMAGLRSDLLMLSSAVALAHARGRLPENLREEFDHAINAPQQSPENLKAVINHIKPWMVRMAQMGNNPGTAPAVNAKPNITHIWTPNGLQAVGGNQ